MASYLPPTENLPTFNPSVFDAGEEALTYDKASKLFLKYPTAQGTETLIDVNVAGTAEIDTLNVLNTSEFQGDTIINNGENRLKINGDTNFVIIDVNNTTAQNLIVGTEYSTNGFISGYQACRDSIQVNDSIIIGYDSCANLNNYTEGDIKGFKNTTAIGKGTLSQISSKWDNDANTALGCEAGNTIQNGSYNVFVGRSAGATDGPPNEVQILEANNCSFIGSNTGVEFDNVVYNNSTALGYGAIITDNNQIQLGTVDEYVNIPNYIKFPDGTTQNTAGGGGGGSGVNTSNTLTGHPYTSAGTGSGSTIGGAFVGTGLTAFGVNSLSNVVFGENNCAVGSYSGHNILDGNYNTLTGENSGLNITYGSSNTCLGYNSGASIVSNNDNTLIGSNTNVSSTLINSSTALGINAIANESGQIQLGTTSNYVNIPNTLKLTNNVPSATTNKNIIDNSSITLTGTASQINVITPTFYSITNSADNTSTLTPTELSVFNSDNFQTVNKGVLSSTDLTITGATASDTNIKNSSSDTITNGTAIASMALVSNVPTITEITSTTGTSSYLTPGSLALYNNDSAKTINNSILTNSALNFKGTTSSYISSLDIDKSIIGDSTNDRFVSNGISYNSSGNSVNYIGPYVYCGTTSPTAPADATNALLLTKENICVYNSNSSRSTNRSLLSSNSLSITGSSSTNTNTKNSSSDTITNGTASIQSALLSSVPTLTAKTSSTGTSSYLTPASLSLYTNNNNTTTNKSVLTQSGLLLQVLIQIHLVYMEQRLKYEIMIMNHIFHLGMRNYLIIYIQMLTFRNNILIHIVFMGHH